MASIEDLLLMRLERENAEKPNNAEAFLAGSAIGGTAGAIAGTGVHQLGRGINAIKDSLAARQGLSRSKAQQFRGAIRPGFRMAGGLVGAILGGALGMGTRQMMIGNSPTAALLAKAKVQGGLTDADTRQLQALLTEEYKQMGIR